MKYKAKEIWARYRSSLGKNVTKHMAAQIAISQYLLKYTKPLDKVLEVGCGSGVQSSYISTKERNAFSLDYSTYALKTAKDVNSFFGTKTHLVLSDIRNLPFKSESFDLVFSCGLLQYFKKSELDPMMKEQKRVLKTGGVLIADVPYSFSAFTFIKYVKMLLKRWPWGWETQYSREKLEKLFGKYEFQVVACYFWGLDPITAFFCSFQIFRASLFMRLKSIIAEKFPVNIGMVGRKTAASVLQD